jgi:peptide deformylase
MLKANLLPIRIYGDKILKEIAEPVKVIDEELKQFIKDLVFTMYKRDGVGLAAPQVGRSLRIFVIDPYWSREENKKEPIVLINPEIIEKNGEQVCEEGCLSVPDVFEKVSRFNSIKVRFMNPEGESLEIDAEEYVADVIQHENDHLDGVLFIDRLSKIRLIPLKPRLRKLQSTTNENGENIVL